VWFQSCQNQDEQGTQLQDGWQDADAKVPLQLQALLLNTTSCNMEEQKDE